MDTPREVAGVDWIFNAWGGGQGGLYPDWQRDRAVASTIISKVGVQPFACPIVLEGGSKRPRGLRLYNPEQRTTTVKGASQHRREFNYSKAQVESSNTDHWQASGSVA